MPPIRDSRTGQFTSTEKQEAERKAAVHLGWLFTWVLIAGLVIGVLIGHFARLN